MKNFYPSLATLENIKDIVPAVLRIESQKRKFNVHLRSGKIKTVYGLKKLHFYLGWLLTHDSLIKTK